MNCPKCGKPARCLAGESGHPLNWYCSDETGCGWQAWVEAVKVGTRTASRRSKNTKDAAIKQREQCAKDAERYRWLRNESGHDGMPYIRCDDLPAGLLDYWVTGSTADRCIDAAMARRSGQRHRE